MASRASEAPAHEPRYRPAAPFPPVVKANCRIYLDEEDYISALTLLADLVTPGASHPNHLHLPTYAPEPYHLEIISTLLVHPQHTSRSTNESDVEIASRCICLLRNVLAIIGPANANLCEAFSFRQPEGTRRNRQSRNRNDDNDDSSSDDDDDRIRGIVANQGRIRMCAKDFWHVVGWALNCSIVYPKRWKYWKAWLDFMLDVLDADWKEREEKDNHAVETRITGDKKEKTKHTHVRKSLLMQYLSDVKGRSSSVKRIVGAVFADGGEEDLKAYPEVFPNETTEIKPPNGHKRKRGHGDEIFHCGCGETESGGYPSIACEKCDIWQHILCLGFSEKATEKESFHFICSDCMAAELAESPNEEINTAEEARKSTLGGTESMVLRQRILVMLSKVSFMFPDSFTILDTLYNGFVDKAIDLPLPAFSLLVTASDSSCFSLDVYVTLIQYIFSRLLPKTAPHPRTIHQTDHDDLTQEILEQCMLPFSANTVATDDNARVSVLAENAFRLLIKQTLVDFDSSVYHTPGLYDAVEKGIKAREAKCKGDPRRKKEATRHAELEDREWLTGSSSRLRSLVLWVERMGQAEQ